MGPTGMVGPIYLSSPLPGRMASSTTPHLRGGGPPTGGPPRLGERADQRVFARGVG